MTDRELDEVLKRRRIPEPSAEEWEEFPRSVTREIRRREGVSSTRAADVAGTSSWWSRPIIAIAGVAMITVVCALLLGNRQTSANATGGLAEAEKYYREIAPLFPQQVRAIVFEKQETRLVLAERADVPTSAPIYLKICGAGECRRFVTFSGQQVRVNGHDLDVLTDAKGGVIVAGPDLVWRSEQRGGRLGEYRIEAERLEARL